MENLLSFGVEVEGDDVLDDLSWSVDVGLLVAEGDFVVKKSDMA